MRIFLTIYLLIISFSSFSVGPEIYNDYSKKSTSMLESVVSDTLVKMERTVCFGTCPSYTLSILKSGRVTFNGKQFVDHKGLASGEISQENLDQLIHKIHESHFMEVASYPECESRYTDMPSVYLTIEIEGERNSVTHYQGCKGFEFEEKLYDLETAIDSLSGTQKWIKGEK